MQRWTAYGDFNNRRLEMLEIVALAGANEWRMVRELQLTNADREEAADDISACVVQRLVIVNRGSSDPRRSWPVENFAAEAMTLELFHSTGMTIGYRSHGKPASTPRPGVPGLRPARPARAPSGSHRQRWRCWSSGAQRRMSALLNTTTLGNFSPAAMCDTPVSLHNSSRARLIKAAIAPMDSGIAASMGGRPHAAGNRGGQVRLACRTGQDHRQPKLIGQLVSHLCEQLRRPALVTRACAGMHAQVSSDRKAVGHGRCRPARVRPLR